MSMQDLFVYIIVAGCVLWSGRHFFRQVIRRKGQAGGCGCTGCSGCTGCALHKDLDSLKNALALPIKRFDVSGKTHLRFKQNSLTFSIKRKGVFYASKSN